MVSKEKKIFSFSEQFPEFDKLEQEYNASAPSEKLNELDKQRFQYVNPLQNSLSQRKMYWDSKSERGARILIIFAQICLVVISYFFGRDILGQSILLLADQLNFQFITDLEVSFDKTIGIIFLTLSALYSLLYFIPMAVCRRAGTIFGWAVAYIIFAVFYFLIMMVFIVMALVVFSSFKFVAINLAIYLTMIFILVVIWIVGAAVLIVKADDIKQQISVE
ncbi:hypothetical protein [Spiroplasma endosymbiont of Nephrotoma flavescens]|uniref:hypothetical protein n=1 Tax=Spiroplasma endosymbiont of Nephrotoma flavescens TaxID=3066302 RepID=UPI00313AEF6E